MNFLSSLHDEFALQSLNEQARIVDKVGQLMALCDRLEQQIDNTASKRTALLNAVMAQA
jgi:restriction endonuclease S subunit